MFMFFLKNKNVKEYPTLHFDKHKLIIYMGYWPSVRSRWLDIDKTFFLPIYRQYWVEVHNMQSGRAK